MAQIGCFLWAIFFIILGFSMMPEAMTISMIIGAIGGVFAGIQKNKEQKKKEERERQKRREKWKRIANKKNLTDDFDPV